MYQKAQTLFRMITEFALLMLEQIADCFIGLALYNDVFFSEGLLQVHIH